MTKSLSYFFRHPHPIYFSVEKLFHTLAEELKKKAGDRFIVKEFNLPYTSKLSTIRKNIRFTRKSQSAVNHITGDVQYAILGCSRKNINILTIHDCVLLHHYPKYHPKHWFIRWFWYQLPVTKADAVTVISENTKKDLLYFTGCPAEKIHIIQNFIDPAFKPVSKSFNSERPRLLFIGTAPNKNFDRTLEALQGLNIELLIVGYPEAAQIARLDEKKIPYRLLNKLSDTEMRAAYAESDIMIFPSTYEGFGLPIIEAQATGRPVLTSRLEPMVSVAGTAASLVDPYDVDSIRSGLKKILDDGAYRNELVEKGFENVKRFQLENVARQYLDLYDQMIKEKAD